MATMDLVLYPDAPLLEKAAPVITFDAELATLAQNMIETMKVFDGVGLAAPQVGVSKRIFVVGEVDQEPFCVVNPELSDLEGKEMGEEGCLSMPRVYAPVSRATRLRLTACNERGEPIEVQAKGMLARIIQHEYDHLEGVLFPDRLDILSRETLLREWTEVRKELLEAINRP